MTFSYEIIFVTQIIANSMKKSLFNELYFECPNRYACQTDYMANLLLLA